MARPRLGSLENGVKDTPPAQPRYGATTGDTFEVTGAVPATPAIASQLEFTGIGSEYFRIWVVNMLLTVLTLGIYSAWAKVRKTRYFLQNTRLDSHAFDYHGDPKAILLGRIVALVLLVCYSVAFDVSRATGLVMVVVMCVIGPWLFMRAQRFRFANTSWRGLRFGFDTRPGAAYRFVLLPLVIWFSTIVATAFLGTGRNVAHTAGAVAAAGVLTAALTPWMHHRLKAYQHDRARYADEAFSFVPATRAFYAIYGTAVLLVVLGWMLGFGVVLVAGVIFATAGGVQPAPKVLAILVGSLIGLVIFLVAWPYFAARMQQVVWRHTRLGEVRFHSRIEAMPLARVTFRNVVLTLATLGLYWPFAAVALARYRVQCMSIESQRPLRVIAQATHAPPGAAAGDAALDAFGLDIGL
jgi:uncharacterized membrane protein YjgN (DUF898 family)